jgi:phosphatidylglycerol:prolipoprotein diacylglycerol transferase
VGKTMLRTLFHIPNEMAGMPMFGAGLLLAIWCGLSVALMLWVARRQGFTADTWGYVPLLALVALAIWWVLPRLADAHGLPIRGFGLMLLLAVVSAVGLAARRAQRLGIEVDLIYTLAFWALVPGILGARLFYVIQKWPQDFAPIYQQHGLAALLGSLVNIAQGGIVLYGSLIGALAGLAAFLIHYRMPLLATLDLLTPSLMLGLAVGRLGCFLNGCCFGGACELPWAVSFPAGSPPHVEQVYRGQAFLFGLKIGDGPKSAAVITDVEPGSPAARQGLAPGQTIASIAGHEVSTADQTLWFLFHAAESNEPVEITVWSGGAVSTATLTGPAGKSAPVHPTQLYSSINAGLLCLFFLAYAPFARRDGELWALLLSIYPVTRFLLEIIRTDERSVFGTGMTISQNVSLLLLVVAAATWFYVLRKPPGRAFSDASPQTA